MSLAPPTEQRTLKVVFAGDLYLFRITEPPPFEVEIFIGNQNVAPVTQEWKNLPATVQEQFMKQLNKQCLLEN